MKAKVEKRETVEGEVDLRKMVEGSVEGRGGG